MLFSNHTRSVVAILLAVYCWGLSCSRSAAEMQTRHVLFVSTDGLRWQEVFQGADPDLMNKEFGGVTDTNALRQKFLRTTPQERRQALFPFLWSTGVKEGQLWGNQLRGSVVRVANGRNFSYPGYSEFLTGSPDASIESNDKRLNPNTNVLEWLHGQPGFRGKVAAVVNWEVIPWILNAPRAAFPVWSSMPLPPGSIPLKAGGPMDAVMRDATPQWKDVALDTFAANAARWAIEKRRPRVLYVAFGETDEWAHEGRYDLYLQSAHRVDRFIGQMWALAQSIPSMRGRTSLVVVTDHGRGPAPVAWKNHGAAIGDSSGAWVAVIGPDTPSQGERENTGVNTQGQAAATVAALLGKDFVAANPRATPALPGVIRVIAK